jgi:hypothetical protein
MGNYKWTILAVLVASIYGTLSMSNAQMCKAKVLVYLKASPFCTELIFIKDQFYFQATHCYCLQ